eukprot:COSAG03_NODE_3476_length_1990_cov_10.290851_1_plen_262_part_00
MAEVKPVAEASARKKEIYTYEAPWLIYGMNWSNRRNKPFRLALGSFIEEYNNSVEVVQLNEETQAFERQAEGAFNHPYPTTKIMWSPEGVAEQPSGELLATTGDYLRLWEVAEDGSIKNKCMLNNHRESEFCAPLTSFDWNETDTNLIGTSSIDTTCTIWDIETQQVRTQLIAHDKEVYDIAFASGTLPACLPATLPPCLHASLPPSFVPFHSVCVSHISLLPQGRTSSPRWARTAACGCSICGNSSTPGSSMNPLPRRRC